MDLVEISAPRRRPPSPPAGMRRPAPRRDATARDHELLFALLAPCLGWSGASEAASAALARFGGLGAALEAPEAELAALPALGEAGAATLAAAAAAAKHLGARGAPERPVLRSPACVLAHLRAAPPSPAGLRAIFLDARDRVVTEEAAGRAEAAAAGRVLRRAIALNAAAVLVLRHAPGATPAASAEDLVLARRLALAGEVMEVALRDHLVLGRGAPLSLRGAGLLG